MFNIKKEKPIIPDFVEDAYHASLRGCFAVLVDSLVEAEKARNPVEEKRAVIERFKKCLELNREARDIYALLLQED